MKYTFLVQQCSLTCRLPGGLCIHQIRVQPEWTFTFENPLVPYFLLAVSWLLLGRNVCGWEVHCLGNSAEHTAQLSLLVTLFLLDCAVGELAQLSETTW